LAAPVLVFCKSFVECLYRLKLSKVMSFTLGELYEWIEIFRRGQACVTGAEPSECPSISAGDVKLEENRALVIQGRRVPKVELIRCPGVQYSAVCDNFGFFSVCTRWVSRRLTEQKHSHVFVCCLLQHYRKE